MNANQSASDDVGMAVLIRLVASQETRQSFAFVTLRVHPAVLGNANNLDVPESLGGRAGSSIALTGFTVSKPDAREAVLKIR